jgi:hypothetical protein
VHNPFWYFSATRKRELTAGAWSVPSVIRYNEAFPSHVESKNRLQCSGYLRKFNGMKTLTPTVGFRHLRRSWTTIPGWVAS